MESSLKYLTHFGLRYNPFPVAPDSKNFFFSQTITQTVSELIHGIEARKGFLILVGEVGLGKTTIGKKILAMLEKRNIKTSWVFNTRCEERQLLKDIIADFGLEPCSENSGELFRQLNQFLLAQAQEGRNCALIIDDAQNLDTKSLEMIRMLSSLESDHEKLLQILLIGQPELLKKLDSPELRQLKSRIVIQKQALPLSRDELRDYIIFRLTSAGSCGSITLRRSALNYIHRVTKGNFRKVNILMDRCLYAGFVLGVQQIDSKVVRMAWKDLNPSGRGILKRKLLALAAAALVLAGVGVIHLAERNTVSVAQGVSDFKAGLGTDSVPEPVVQFMRDYGAIELAGEFYSALKGNSLEVFSQEMYKTTGLELISLKELPAHVKDRYGVLCHPYGPEGSSTYFLFWKPPIKFSRFYYGYKGKEVERLQELLAQFDYYCHKVDGVVGRNLMKAVVAFQEEMGLEVTGFPDSNTLFLLSNLSEVFKSAGSVQEKATG